MQNDSFWKMRIPLVATILKFSENYPIMEATRAAKPYY